MARSTADKQDASAKLTDVRQGYRVAAERTYSSMQDLELAWARMEEYRAMFDTNDPDEVDQLAEDNAWLDDKLTSVLTTTGGNVIPQNLSITLAHWIDLYVKNMKKGDGSAWTRDEVLDQLKVANIPPYEFPSP
jgi:hypothetical protein